jgi:ribonucleoside-diphosphate reductase alpha chain
LRVDHPDIVEFVHAKNNTDKLTGFNTSVAITDEFMQAVTRGKPFMTRFGGATTARLTRRALGNDYALNMGLGRTRRVVHRSINRMNNLWYCETLAATNPCGEQPLPPFGACLLGSFNLVKYVTTGDNV